ncbi:hypothetical protein GLOTRDRAFT_109752 [Gloeophyllum trabeum ATCC 11539]|uniref:DUF2423 domain-containing protein n=1 Tax=Gloeophyllum trabeum (strain ATCC 11539 / FP-39264 / Madison 617) TaxID=670483 RepID=S7RXC6_GLOTA|nr:uncharacterized protein GLOTRDRAFT_109752 [Gloeophyllum trabeum ATCC 11539]EPQ59555.1 hypothetical protein GLOTRDRAFT_109752 [Gloeophyllum trabeum ATCC 11539]
MAKSLRSKTKRAFRSKKREAGVYAATEAARLNRLNQKLVALKAADPEDFKEIPVEGEADKEEGWTDEMEPDSRAVSNTNTSTDAMDLDPKPSSSSQPQKISTHGPRNSRREQWRVSKGMPARPQQKGMNRQGGIAARRKAGRSHRRR